jgi:D-alanyl-lipoteichoic acid acyltransferase DltB (MBOAT superfamily)
VLFNSLLFLGLFLPATLLVYWLLPTGRWRLLFLVVASLVFYGWWDWRYIPLLVVSAGADWLAGETLARSADRRLRRAVLTLALTLNLGLLAYFKYRGFFLGSFSGLGDLLGVEMPSGAGSFVLPVGISFYTFNGMAYAIDLYRGTARRAPTVLHFAAFVAMFPSLLAGPIVRWSEIGGQLERLPRRLPATLAAGGITFLAMGLAKKLLVADVLAPYVDDLFAASGDLGLAGGWAATVGYALQLYFDFSGYSDMAVGLGLLLGLKLPQNFDSPYKSTGFGDFWRRWHMSLSYWFRDYLYIPLGGSRRGLARTLLNLVAVMALVGLWHGPAWTFVLWGVAHGGFLAAERLWRRAGLRMPWTWLSRGLTFAAVVAAWALFRASSMSQAGEVLAAMAGAHGVAARSAAAAVPPALAALLLAGLLWVNLAPNTWELRLRPRKVWAAAIGLLLGAAVLAISEPQAFVYLRF